MLKQSLDLQKTDNNLDDRLTVKVINQAKMPKKLPVQALHMQGFTPLSPFYITIN